MWANALRIASFAAKDSSTPLSRDGIFEAGLTGRAGPRARKRACANEALSDIGSRGCASALHQIERDSEAGILRPALMHVSCVASRASSSLRRIAHAVRYSC